jgi:glycosyltransferase involved in cell wall biosynthesis
MQAQPLPISVCVISNNEAHRIRRLLESVNGWTQEIIVVLNDDSNDGTDRIAAEYGAKVFREPWKGHIAQKNSALQKATATWILGLDADEAISENLLEELRALFSEPTRISSFAAFQFPRCTLYCGKWIRHGDWYPDRQTRLWRRGAAAWGGIDPHDKLIVEGQVGRLCSDMLHYSAETINFQITKTVRYADDFVRHCIENRKTVTLMDLTLRPIWRFCRAYILRMGFLDGWRGFAIAWLTAFYTFLRYVRVFEARLTQSNREFPGR